MKTRADAIKELLERTTFGDGCWEWQGSRISSGYGEIRADGVYLYVHRLAYEHFVGPIPEGHVPDHLCQNPPCWRPDHLEAVTHAENIRRGFERIGKPLTCGNGHSWDGNRRYSRRGNGKPFSQCKVCERDRYHAKNPSAPYREYRWAKAAPVCEQAKALKEVI